VFYLCLLVCLFVLLSVNWFYWKTINGFWWIFWRGRGGRGPGTIDYILTTIRMKRYLVSFCIQEMFKGFFIFYCDSCREPIHKNLWRWSVSALVTNIIIIIRPVLSSNGAECWVRQTVVRWDCSVDKIIFVHFSVIQQSREFVDVVSGRCVRLCTFSQ